MRDILPDFVREVIRERYITGVSDAEATFRLNSEDEDSLTGALGQALATPKPIVVWDNEQVFVIQIQHHKVRGKGPGAPEKILGTDGIFELEVFDGDGHSIRKKGLPFQSKKNWKSSNKKVA